MMLVVLKALGTAAFIVALSEVARRSTLIAALMVALPLATMLTVANIYIGGGDARQATRFATSTFYLVAPGLTFFIVLPLAQRLGLHFWPSLILAILLTGLACWGFVAVMRRFGVIF